MTDALFAVQQAVIAALAADAGVQGVLGATPALYDHVPPGAAFPYVTYGASHILPHDAKTETGFEQIVTLDIWSRYRGGMEARAIFAALYAALHRAVLTVTDQVFLSCEFHSGDIALDSDGLTTHAAARFSIITQST
ncbi:MAG: DUF3168 domain-containing protein [Alphaproteobacteria bacterium]|nr:DUF3168 domain-containing protein [Alphaproteobacteria bacterium]